MLFVAGEDESPIRTRENERPARTKRTFAVCPAAVSLTAHGELAFAVRLSEALASSRLAPPQPPRILAASANQRIARRSRCAGFPFAFSRFSARRLEPRTARAIRALRPLRSSLARLWLCGASRPFAPRSQRAPPYLGQILSSFPATSFNVKPPRCGSCKHDRMRRSGPFDVRSVRPSETRPLQTPTLHPANADCHSTSRPSWITNSQQFRT